MKKSDVASTFKRQRDLSRRAMPAQYNNTDLCWAFYNADHMNYSDKIQFYDTRGEKRMATVKFNKVQNNVDSVAGFMAQNRRQAKYIARVNADRGQQIYSKHMNAIYDYTRENANADQVETDQDMDMLVNGYGAIETDLSYIVGNATTMPNGEILQYKVDPNCFYWDTLAIGKNMLDARWMGYWRDYDLKEALNLFQKSKEDDFETVSVDRMDGDRGYTFNPYGGLYDKIKALDSVEWCEKENDMVRVYNHQWMEYETFYRMNNPIYTVDNPMDAMFIQLKLESIQKGIKTIGDSLSGDMFDFNPSSPILTFDQSVKTKLEADLGPFLPKITPLIRKAFYTAVISGKHVFSWFRNVSQQGFTIKVKTGNYNRSEKIWMGMVNPMMEPTRYYNKALTELMFTIAANSKGGVMVEEDAVESVADFEKKWAKTDAVIKVNNGAISGNMIQEKAKGALPTGLENIIQLADANIMANGVDPSFLGQLDREDQSGILFKRRIRQVISKLARYFDSITLYQKEHARLSADLIRIWVENNQGELLRLTGEDGAKEFIIISQDILAAEYDVSIEEASQSSEEKQETAVLFFNTGDKLMLAGDPLAGKAFIAEGLQKIPLDGDARTRLLEVLQPKDQIDPQAFAMLQAENAQLKQLIQSGQVEKTASETEKNRAITVKTLRDADISAVQVPKVQADTMKSLEEAKRTAVEADMAMDASSNEVSVSI